MTWRRTVLQGVGKFITRRSEKKRSLSLSVCSHTKLREVRIGNEVRESEGWRVWFIQVLNPNLRTSIGREAYNFPHFLEHSRQRRERDLSGNGKLMSKINIYYISLECLTIR